MSSASDEDPADGVTSSPKRNRAKVQKTKGSHGGARANAGRKPNTSKLTAAAMGTSTLHTMGFKADYGTKATTATCVNNSNW